MTLDTVDELHKILATYPDAGLVVRLMVDDSQSLSESSVANLQPFATLTDARFASSRSALFDQVWRQLG